jgi:hypothetical protein
VTEPKPGDRGVGPGLGAYRWVVAAIVTFFVVVIVGVAAFLGAPLSACACSSVMPSPTPIPPSPVVGVVVAIDQVSLTQVNSFEVRMTGGETVRLKVGALDNATQFSLSHLATHMATGVPILAFYRLEGGEPVVYHLEDAVPATSSPAAT